MRYERVWSCKIGIEKAFRGQGIDGDDDMTGSGPRD